MAGIVRIIILILLNNMKIQVKPCNTVGNTYMVVKISKFGRVTKLAIGLTKFEAVCLKKRLTSHNK